MVEEEAEAGPATTAVTTGTCRETARPQGNKAAAAEEAVVVATEFATTATNPAISHVIARPPERREVMEVVAAAEGAVTIVETLATCRANVQRPESRADPQEEAEVQAVPATTAATTVTCRANALLQRNSSTLITLLY